jgi:hypothetical protein
MEAIAVHQSSVDVAKQHFSHRSLPTRSWNSDDAGDSQLSKKGWQASWGKKDWPLLLGVATYD